MPTSFTLAIAAVLICSAAAGLVRVLLGPTAADRVLGVLLSGTTSAAALLVLGEAAGEPALTVTALAAVLLAALLTAVFTRLDPGEDRDR